MTACNMDLNLMKPWDLKLVSCFVNTESSVGKLKKECNKYCSITDSRSKDQNFFNNSSLSLVIVYCWRTESQSFSRKNNNICLFVLEQFRKQLLSRKLIPLDSTICQLTRVQDKTGSIIAAIRYTSLYSVSTCLLYTSRCV